MSKPHAGQATQLQPVELEYLTGRVFQKSGREQIIVSTVSVHSIDGAGDGPVGVCFSAVCPSTSFTCGLTNRVRNKKISCEFDSIDYMMHVHQGRVNVFENGLIRCSQCATCHHESKVEIMLNSQGMIEYHVDGTVHYVSKRKPEYPLFVKICANLQEPVLKHLRWIDQIPSNVSQVQLEGTEIQRLQEEKISHWSAWAAAEDRASQSLEQKSAAEAWQEEKISHWNSWAAAEDRASQSLEQKSAAEACCQQLEEASAASERDVTKMVHHMEVLNLQCQQLEEQKVFVTKKCEDLEHQLAQATVQKMEAEEKMSLESERHADVNAAAVLQASAAAKQIETLTLQCQDLEEQKAIITAKCDQLEHEFAQTLKHKEEDAQKAAVEVKHLAETSAKAEHQAMEAWRQIDTLNLQCQDLAEQKASVIAKCDQLDEELAEAIKRKEDAEKAVTVEVKKQAEATVAAEQQSMEAVRQMDTLNMQCQELEEQKAFVTAKCNQLERDLEEQKAFTIVKSNQLEQKLAEAIKQKEEVEKTVAVEVKKQAEAIVAAELQAMASLAMKHACEVGAIPQSSAEDQIQLEGTFTKGVNDKHLTQTLDADTGIHIIASDSDDVKCTLGSDFPFIVYDELRSDKADMRFVKIQSVGVSERDVQVVETSGTHTVTIRRKPSPGVQGATWVKKFAFSDASMEFQEMNLDRGILLIAFRKEALHRRIFRFPSNRKTAYAASYQADLFDVCIATDIEEADEEKAESDDVSDVLDGFNFVNPADHPQFSDKCSEEMLEVSSQSVKCFLPNTAFPSTDGHLLLVQNLAVGCRVKLCNQTEARVVSLKLYTSTKKQPYNLIELITRQGTYRVSAGHRVAVQHADLQTVGAQRADMLKVGDKVIVGSKERELIKVTPIKARTDLYMVGFEPDGPVEMFPVSNWGMQTWGEPPVDLGSTQPEEMPAVGLQLLSLVGIPNFTELELLDAAPAEYQD